MAHIQREGNEGITVKLTVDTSEAVAELKRLQRVARETTQYLREAESAGNPWGDAKFPPELLRTYTTQELADELARRGGVNITTCRPTGIVHIDSCEWDVDSGEYVTYHRESVTGSSRILVVTD